MTVRDLIAVAGRYPLALLKWGSFSLFRRGDEPKRKPPAFPAVGL